MEALPKVVVMAVDKEVAVTVEGEGAVVVAERETGKIFLERKISTAGG